MKLSILSAFTQSSFVDNAVAFLQQNLRGKKKFQFKRFPVFLNFVLATELKIDYLLSINPEFI